MIITDKWCYIANPRTATTSIHRALKDFGNHSIFPHHSKAIDVKNKRFKTARGRIDVNWDNLFKFGFIRNPYDYWVSQYHRAEWRDRSNNVMSFTDMILSHSEADSQHYYFTDKGKIIVDFIGKYERLTEDFNHICHKIGIKTELPHLNKSNHRPYMEYYTTETRKHVEREFKEDFRLWSK